jgi:hypothetical protein
MLGRMRKLYIYNGSKSHLFLYTFLLIPFSFRLNYQFFDFYLFITGTVDRRESKGGKENTIVIKKRGGDGIENGRGTGGSLL